MEVVYVRLELIRTKFMYEKNETKFISIINWKNNNNDDDVTYKYRQYRFRHIL